jgi:hypothetical protein
MILVNDSNVSTFSTAKNRVHCLHHSFARKNPFLRTPKSSSSRVNPGRISHRTEGFLLSSLMRCLSRDGDLNR